MDQPTITTRTTPYDSLSDDPLLRLWLYDEAEDSGETFIAVYMRFRDAVRAEMEMAGLPPREAENRVGSVFIRAEDTRDQVAPSPSLRDRLMVIARDVALDPTWSAPQ